VDFNVRSATSPRARTGRWRRWRANLDNLTRHLEQTEGMVQAGTRAEIDLVQARTDTANARVAAESTRTTRTRRRSLNLNSAMGVQGPTDYDVEDTAQPPVAAEEPSSMFCSRKQVVRAPEVQSRRIRSGAEQLTHSAFQANMRRRSRRTLGSQRAATPEQPGLERGRRAVC